MFRSFVLSDRAARNGVRAPRGYRRAYREPAMRAEIFYRRPVVWGVVVRLWVSGHVIYPVMWFVNAYVHRHDGETAEAFKRGYEIGKGDGRGEARLEMQRGFDEFLREREEKRKQGVEG